jgi:hypothetical protein
MIEERRTYIVRYRGRRAKCIPVIIVIFVFVFVFVVITVKAVVFFLLAYLTKTYVDVLMLQVAICVTICLQIESV